VREVIDGTAGISIQDEKRGDRHRHKKNGCQASGWFKLGTGPNFHKFSFERGISDRPIYSGPCAVRWRKSRKLLYDDFSLAFRNSF
jgi:hypothetical protein